MMMHHGFVFGADIVIPFTGYPIDTDSREEWELYWRCRTDLDQRHARARRCDPAWLERFEACEARSILFAGNGMSQEPQFFAYAGFDAVAMDLSSEVTAMAARARWQTRTLLDSFGVAPERERSFLRELHRFGGRASYVQGDLFDEAACSGPFDVVITRRTLQLFSGARLQAAIAQLKRRLSERGTLLIEVHQDLHAAAMIKKTLLEQGFQLRSETPQWNAEVLVTT